MKVKVGELLNSGSVWQTIQGQKLSFKTAYRIDKFVKRLDKELEYARAQINTISREFNTTNSDEERAALNARFVDIMETEIEADILPLPMEALGELTLTIGELNAINYAIGD